MTGRMDGCQLRSQNSPKEESLGDFCDLDGYPSRGQPVVAHCLEAGMRAFLGDVSVEVDAAIVESWGGP